MLGEKEKVYQLKSDNFITKDNKFEVYFTKEIIDSFYKNKFNEINYFFKPIYKSNKKMNLITDMKIYFENIIDLKNFKIIEQFDNCYYVKKIYG